MNTTHQSPGKISPAFQRHLDARGLNICISLALNARVAAPRSSLWASPHRGLKTGELPGRRPQGGAGQVDAAAPRTGSLLQPPPFAATRGPSLGRLHCVSAGQARPSVWPAPRSPLGRWRRLREDNPGRALAGGSARRAREADPPALGPERGRPSSRAPSGAGRVAGPGQTAPPV